MADLELMQLLIPKLRRLGLHAASRWGWSPDEWEALRAQLPARVQLVE